MKICAITIVYRDYWALEQWYRHYAKYLGAENLYVISHGVDSEIAKICPNASIINIPREPEDLKSFDRKRLRVINGIQSGLGNLYDWVIQTDADELVCYNPNTYGSFEEMFKSTKAPALFALGLNVAEVEGDKPLKPTDMALAHRSTACVTGNYSKAFAVRKAIPLSWHGVFCGYRKTDDFPFEMPDDVFYVHLKHASLEALAASNTVRQSVADSVGEDWNVNGWAKPDFHAERFFRKTAAATQLPWDEAVALGYEQIRNNLVRDPKRGIIKPPFINYVCRTTLPDLFREI